MRKLAAFAAILAVAAGSVFLAAGSSAPPTLKRADAAMAAKALATPVDVLVRTETRDYSAVLAAVRAHDGRVTRQFHYARGLAATVPVGALGALRHTDGVLGVSLDTPVQMASGVPSVTIPAKDDAHHQGQDGIVSLGGSVSRINDLDELMRQGVAFDLESKYGVDGRISLNDRDVRSVAREITPQTYADAAVMDALPVWDTGNFGQDTIVAVIDSGVYGDHFMLDGSLIGCDDLTTEAGTPNDPDLPCSDPGNVYHGTHVASTIAGHGAILLSPGNPLSAALTRQGGPLLNGSSMGYPGANIVPLLGIAPEAQIYGIKVFRAGGGGASTSLIIQAVEHAVDLKVNGGVDIDVVNMSLGGPSTYDGRDLEAQAIDAATDEGITMVIAAGNSGPGAQTVETPGASNTAIAAGAVADPLHVRVFWDVNFFPNFISQQLFVGDDPQMIYFSSRGDTSDGRSKPQISAPGTFILAAVPSTGNPNGIGFSSGTSMATPGIAGTVALLNTWSEENGDAASPYDYLQAMQAGATPVPGFGTFEQGAGLNDVAAAMAALQADGSLGDAFPSLGPDPASPAVPAGTFLDLSGGSATVHVNNLAPGMQKHYYFPTSLATSKITVDSSHVHSTRDPLHINSFELYVKTATRTYEHYYVESANVFGNAHFEITDRSTTANGNQSGATLDSMLIQPGYTRVTIENDWTSASPISGDFVIGTEEAAKPTPDVSISDSIADGGEDDYGFAPCAHFACRLDLFWDNDWTTYPTSDLDLVLLGYDADTGQFTFLSVGGATLNSPETNLGGLIQLVNGADPDDVDFAYVLVEGFDTHGGIEPYTLNYFEPAP